MIARGKHPGREEIDAAKKDYESEAATCIALRRDLENARADNHANALEAARALDAAKATEANALDGRDRDALAAAETARENLEQEVENLRAELKAAQLAAEDREEDNHVANALAD